MSLDFISIYIIDMTDRLWLKNNALNDRRNGQVIYWYKVDFCIILRSGVNWTVKIARTVHYLSHLCVLILVRSIFKHLTARPRCQKLHYMAWLCENSRFKHLKCLQSGSKPQQEVRYKNNLRKAWFLLKSISGRKESAGSNIS